MPDEQDMIWLKGLQFQLNACNAEKNDLIYILKILQHELKKTKQYINSECRESKFDYEKHIIDCIKWNPESDKRFVTKLKNEIKT